MGSLKKIFKNLPKPLEWRYFYNNDLPLLMDFCEEVQEVPELAGLRPAQFTKLLCCELYRPEPVFITPELLSYNWHLDTNGF